MKSASFKGGLSLPVPEQEEIGEIKSLPLPNRVLVPLGLNQSQACVPVVKKGKKVKEGELIAQGVSSVVLAPITGKIEEIRKDFRLPNGESTTAVSIQTPEDEAPGKSRNNLAELGTLEKVIKSGLYDLTKSPGPLLDKFASHRVKGVKTLIVNCLDEYFVLGRNTALLTSHTEEILKGISILQELSGASQAVLVVYSEAEPIIQALSNAGSTYETVRVEAKHPQHKDQLLVTAVTGEEYPAGMLPEDMGVTVVSAETAYFTSVAVTQNQPILDKLIAVAGGNLEQPVNCFVRIGTPISDVLEQVGIDPDSIGKVIIGGPLTGNAIPDIQIPVTQQTDLIFLQQREEVQPAPQDGVCFKCGFCVEVCPMRLMPFLISGFSEGRHFDLAEKNDIFSCIECGCCAYVCPVHLQMVQWIQFGKSAISAQRS